MFSRKKNDNQQQQQQQQVEPNQVEVVQEVPADQIVWEEPTTEMTEAAEPEQEQDQQEEVVDEVSEPAIVSGGTAAEQTKVEEPKPLQTHAGGVRAAVEAQPEQPTEVEAPHVRQTVVLSKAQSEQQQQQPQQQQRSSSSQSAKIPPISAPLRPSEPPVSPGLPMMGAQSMVGPAPEFLMRYQIYPDNPEVYVGIKKDPETGGYRYIVVEPQMSQAEKQVYAKLTRLLVDELEVDMGKLKDSKSAQPYLVSEAKKLAQKYSIKIRPDSYRKIAYYFTRDYIKLGRIEVLMNDPRIEDISCDGPNIPLFIWHRDYESIPTNVMFRSDDELNTFASKLAYVSGKHISIANPIVDATLPDGSRVQITYGKEVTKKGGTFTIRKFKGDPITVVDMLKYNTLSPELGAYLWYLIERRMSLLVAGGTASGKTTTLNALSMFIPPDQKIVSVEDTPELNLSHKNWIQSVSRGGGVAGEITLFDLLKAALRQRPDIIIVGEVRGVEAFTLFQAIASVSGDTPILLRREGKITLAPVGEFVDSYYKGDAERVPVHAPGVEVLSFDKTGKVDFAPLQYVLRHKADEVYDLRYAGGRVRATGSHSVFVFDESGNVVPRLVSELKPKDVMVSFCSSETEREREDDIIVDVLPILRRTEGHKVVTERMVARCPHCDSNQTIKKGRQGERQRFWCNGCNRTFAYSGDLMFENRLQTAAGEMLVSFEKSQAVPRLMKVDREFSKVLGIYMADGCVKSQDGSSRVVFCLGSQEKKNLFAEDVTRFFARFDSQPSIEDRGTYVLMEFNHSPLAEVFADLCGSRLEEKHLPDFIWAAPTPLVDAFLAGYEADARRTLTKRNSAPMSSLRRDLISQLSWLARMNSRSTYISERDSRYPSVYISKRGRAARADAIPANLLLQLKTALNSNAWRHVPKAEDSLISKERASKALQEILFGARNPMTWDAAMKISTISSLIEGSLIASPVLGIKKERFDGFVYDVSVPGTEAFFGGDSPIALHNTGHGGLGTIHADSVEAAINRITSEPMNVPKSLLGSTLDCLVMQLRIKLKDRSVRRMVHVAEIVGHESSTDQIVLNNAFKWDPVSDQYIFSGRSRLFEKITKRFGTSPEKIKQDLDDRKIFLKWLMTKNIRDYKDVSQRIREFYSDKETIIETALRELDQMN